MFDFAESPFEIPPNFAAVCRETWDQVAAPGTWWSGPERVAIAGAARAARVGHAVADSTLPSAATEVAVMVGGTPAQTTRDWAEAMVEALGEEKYIEAASIASRVVPVDTFTRLVGSQLEPFPAPLEGEPSERIADPPARRGSAWVGMVGFPTPPNVFSAVPGEMIAMNDISNVFYMPEFDMQYPDHELHGLHRTQMEVVASVTSHGNECFY